jgi:hypothetical protein
VRFMPRCHPRAREQTVWTLAALIASAVCATPAAQPAPTPSPIPTAWPRPASTESPAAGAATIPAPTVAGSPTATPPSSTLPGVASPAATPASQGSPGAPSSVPAAVAAARAALAAQLGLSSPDQVRVVSWEEVAWPNSCLGIAARDQMCAQVIVEGYRVILEASGARYEYRTDGTGRQVRQTGPPTSG